MHTPETDMSVTNGTKLDQNDHSRLKQGLALLLAAGVSLLVFIYRDHVAQLGAYGYLGLFIVSIIGSATVILPVPAGSRLLRAVCSTLWSPGWCRAPEWRLAS